MKTIGVISIKISTELGITLPADRSVKQSDGLWKHIQKRHPECLKYIPEIANIIDFPDYIGVNPNEKSTSLELVKIFKDNVQMGIKVDTKRNYLYVATLHTITDAKIQSGLKSGRLMKFTE